MRGAVYRCAIAVALCALLLGCAPGSAAASSETPVAASIETSKHWPEVVPTALDRIALCLSLGNEVVLTQYVISCVQYRQGDGFLNYLKAGSPWDMDVQEICREDSTDRRRLSADSIKKLAANKDVRVAPAGIRIKGAVFCETLDLVGLDLPYSLVIDRSVFRGGIEARNIKVRGDVSFEESLIFKATKILRSQITGSVFADESYIENLVALDSKVEGSVVLRRGVLAQALFDGMTVSGELSVYGSALSTFLIQLSTVHGSLNLGESEARCWYQVRKSEVGELIAADAGFGTFNGHDAGWIRKKTIVARINESLPVQQSGEWGKVAKLPERCAVGGKLFEFVLYEVHVRSTLCLRSFHWVANEGGPLASFLAVSSTTVDGNAIINLWPNSSRRPVDPKDIERRYQPTFEAVALKAGGLILNFRDSDKPLRTYINGLRFDRIYSADIECTHASFSSNGLLMDGSQTTFISERQLRAPDVDDIKKWLGMNRTKSAQPFTPFIEAFDRVGEDAKPLRVARADKEIDLLRKKGTPDADAPPGSNLADTNAASWMSTLENGGYVAFRAVLAAVADHGFRPVKAIPWIIVLIAVCGLFFWFGLGIVGFRSDKSERIFPIGGLFLLDRLIPLYNFNDAHQSVAAFYRWRPFAKIPETATPVTVRYLWFRFQTVEASETEARVAEFFLAMLKIFGVILAVFLVAAINALVTR